MGDSVPCLEHLPPELLDRVVGLLPQRDVLNLGLVSLSFFHAVHHHYAALSDLRLVFEDGICSVQNRLDQEGCEDEGTFYLTLTLCQCPRHLHKIVVFLRNFLLKTGHWLKQVIIEDYLLKPDSCVDGRTLDVILDHSPRLESFELHHLDLTLIPPSTLAKIGTLRRLNQLHFGNCSQKSLLPLDDRLLIGISLRGTLKQLQMTQCNAIGDRALRQLARLCPLLWYADFSDCRNVTAKGISYFARSMESREPDMVYLKIKGTDVTGSELQRHLWGKINHPHSPALARKQWELTSIRVGIAGDPGCAIQNISLPNKTLVLLV